MSYLIQPDSDVYLLHNIPLDVSQEHSIVFDNKTQQYNYFTTQNRVKFRFADYSYQRHSLGVIKVEKCADDLYDINYMMFRNTAFGNKWFYAFVTNVEYVNNVTSAVTYEIDPLQTWLFDFDVKQCFVVREMPVDDYANEQLVDEPLETGEYVVSDFYEYDDLLTNPNICVMATNVLVHGGAVLNPLTDGIDYEATYGHPESAHPTFAPTDLKMSTNGDLPLALAPIIFPNSPTGRKNLMWYYGLMQKKNQTDAFVNMFLIPNFVSVSYTITVQGQGDNIKPFVSCYVSTATRPYKFSRLLYLGDPHKSTKYQPKNMKLYNYPFSFAFISDGQGNFAPFKPQYFTDNDGYFNFSVKYSVASSCEVMFVPNNYKGMALNYNESYVFDKFPQLAWVSDYYKEYWARNKVDITTGIMANAISGGFSIYNGFKSPLPSQNGYQNLQNNWGRMLRKGYPVGTMADTYRERLNNERNSAIGEGIAGSVDNALMIGNILGNLGIARQMSDKMHGTMSTDTMTATGNLRVFSGCLSVTQEMARVIDDYFTRFGYATHLSKVPNWRTNRRPFFNYVQTKDTNINGTLPQDDMGEIISIFEKGITWWNGTTIANNNYIDRIGDYSVVNIASHRGQYRS